MPGRSQNNQQARSLVDVARKAVYTDDGTFVRYFVGHLLYSAIKERYTMTPAYFQELYDFNDWNNHRVWDCLLALSDEQVVQPVDESDWSLLIHCLHIIAVEDWWLRFLATGEVQFLDWDAFPDRAALRAQWDVTAPMVRAYVAALTPEELQRDVRPPFWEDGRGPIKVYQALTQVPTHSADHRAQMLTHIRRLGAPTVEQDFLGYLFQKQNA